MQAPVVIDLAEMQKSETLAEKDYKNEAKH